MPVTTIRHWRTDGKGPCAIKAGGRVRFAVSDVLAWLTRQRESDPGRVPTAPPKPARPGPVSARLSSSIWLERAIHSCVKPVKNLRSSPRWCNAWRARQSR